MNSTGHFMEVYACGHIGQQCHCPGPKRRIELKGKCPACRKQEAEGQESPIQ